MVIKQLSIFVENQQGKMAEVTEILAKNNINIRALSIGDTKDFGILRLIVDNPDTAKDCLKKDGFTVSLTNVIAVGLEDKPGSLSYAMKVLSENSISVEYMYAFIGRNQNNAYVVLRVENCDATIDALKKANIQVLEEKDVYKA